MDFNLEKFEETIKTPKFNIEKGDKYVQNGEDNRLPNHLVDLYNNVAVHRAIIDKKVNLFNGDGITFDAEVDDKKSINTQKFIDAVNPFENMEALLNKIALDWFLFKGSYVAVKWNKTGTKVLELYHLPYHKGRVGAADDFGFISNCYYRKTDDVDDQWDEDDMLKDTDINYPMFSTSKNKGKTQILFIKEYNVSSPFYPLPDYFGARRNIETLKMVSEFWNDGIANGLMPSHSIFAFGEMSAEEKGEFTKDLKTKYGQKVGGTGKPLVGVFANPEQKIQIEAIEASNLDKMYIQLAKDTTEAVAAGHQYPLILAMSTPGKLGGTSEVIDHMELFITTYIAPNQKQVLGFLNKIMAVNNLLPISIINKQLKTPITLATIDPAFYLTKDEIREELGFNSLGQDEVIDDIEADNNEDKTNENE